MNTGIEFAEKLSKAYSETCKPLCHELNIPQTAFDILLFLANNPEYKTARDIVEIRKIKANLVSVNVDKLVNEGYLERKSCAENLYFSTFRLCRVQNSFAGCKFRAGLCQRPGGGTGS